MSCESRRLVLMPDAPLSTRHRIVVVGAGFGGLEAVKGLAKTAAEITLVDQRNHHIFQPLLYQVATASLAPSEIAWPIRSIIRRQRNVKTILATVNGIDVQARMVLLDGGASLPFDTLVLATGARHAYFGHDEWEPVAPGLKTIEDATEIRGRILLAFEQAEREPDAAVRAALLTFVIVGAGPTGVELAGTIAELARDTLAPDFRKIDTQMTRVVLIEAGHPRTARLCREPFRVCAAIARRSWRHRRARPCRLRLFRRWSCLRRSTSRGPDDHLGGRCRRICCSDLARRAGGPGRSSAREYGPNRARPSRDICDRRHRQR